MTDGRLSARVKAYLTENFIFKACSGKCYHRLTLYPHLSDGHYANCFTIGYSRVIKKRRDGFTYGLAEKRGKPLSLVIKRCSLFLFSRTHANSVVVVHEKKYSLEELQTMVDDMDYGLRLTIRTVSRRVL
uniref:Uncharacterized protein n=1 Tax=Brassica oleracea TaxID=3712 RepID=A0A3P6DPC0_BRAOL|nr:unnamed protein product [Brassica oleracea]